jgi:hypothetical protein
VKTDGISVLFTLGRSPREFYIKQSSPYGWRMRIAFYFFSIIVCGYNLDIRYAIQLEVMKTALTRLGINYNTYILNLYRNKIQQEFEEGKLR